MTWFNTSQSKELPGDRLENLWLQPGILRVPGAHNALAGLLAKQEGFQALYLSGGALSASLGLPDLGLITPDELLVFVRTITRSTQLPLIVDGDTGYGEALNVMRLVQDLEISGAAAVQLEDQVLPKKCGHLSGKLLNDPESMAEKIAAGRSVRKHLRIIARTDAVASEGLSSAIRRANLYIEAGADVIFPEALTSIEDMKTFNQEVNAPTLVNMTEFGKTPYLTHIEFAELGFKLVIWPVSSLRCEAEAVRKLYSHLAMKGGQKDYLDNLMTRKNIYNTIGYHDYEILDKTISLSVVPEDNRIK